VILVDTALDARERAGKPLKVGLVGAGFSGRNIAHQIFTSFPAIRLVAICNRTIPTALGVYASAGLTAVHLSDPSALDTAIRQNRVAVTDDPAVLCRAEEVDAIIETTGSIDFAAAVVLEAVRGGKHVILVNVELDATLGPILKTYANRAGVVYTNTDGDEPGVAMNILRFVKSIGLEPVVAGNLKGLYDPYRTPDTQRAFADALGQKAKAVTSFADGTKLSFELTVLANATGFGVGKRGMYGPALHHVNDGGSFFLHKLIPGGMVDFVLGAAPGSGAFVVARTEDQTKAKYLKYLKMGDGPLYTFYTPYHLPQMEVPLTVARAVLFRDATASPMGGPVCDSIAVAKRDLKPGDVLDGIGGFACYALIENYGVSRREGLLPMGVSEGCRLVTAVPKDAPVRYSDVELPHDRLCDRLRHEQDVRFPSAPAAYRQSDDQLARRDE
jgi:predicted homoserine dehydrogenase-like protein